MEIMNNGNTRFILIDKNSKEKLPVVKFELNKGCFSCKNAFSCRLYFISKPRKFSDFSLRIIIDELIFVAKNLKCDEIYKEIELVNDKCIFSIFVDMDLIEID